MDTLQEGIDRLITDATSRSLERDWGFGLLDGQSSHFGADRSREPSGQAGTARWLAAVLEFVRPRASGRRGAHAISARA